MKDPLFIEGILAKGKAAKEKAKTEFSGISAAQFNWKPSPDAWSIAQCLEHLIISHTAYFPVLEKIKEGTHRMGFWAKYSPFSKVWGSMFKSQLSEEVRKKMKAPKKLLPPASSNIKIEEIEAYYKNLDIFLDYISDCRDIDIDKVILHSPIIPFITYSLRNVFQFMIQHEHRHINQAVRVKANEKFPKE